MRGYIYLGASIFLLVILGYLIYNKKRPGIYISQLSNITSIKIKSINGDSLFEINDEKNIKYFLSTFIPSQKNIPKGNENFKLSGYIIFMEANEVKFKIDIDYNYGYSCKIKDTDYLEQFTYATHRYLMDIR